MNRLPGAPDFWITSPDDPEQLVRALGVTTDAKDETGGVRANVLPADTSLEAPPLAITTEQIAEREALNTLIPDTTLLQ